MPLTDTALKTFKPATKAYRAFDLRGLYVEVSPTGGRLWRLKYRFEGKEKRLALGTYPDVSLREARERRDEARKLIASGVDPGENRRATKLASAGRHANTFEVVALEWYNKQSPGWVPAHQSRMLALFKRDVFPYLGSKPLADITPDMVLAMVQKIEGRALETAHRALASCGQVFRYGVASRRCAGDPTRDLRGYLASVKTKHFAATTEPKRLGAILAMMDAYPGTRIVSCALRLAPLVFVRPTELRTARWEDIDLEGESPQWAFTVTKTDTEHIVPLSSQAAAILRVLHPLTGPKGYVFPSARGRMRPMSDNAVLVALRTLEIAKEEMSGHGFRAVARTILDEVLGFRVDIIEHQLAHTVRDPLGTAYNRTKHLQERRRMMQAWADHLDTLKSTTS